MYHYVRPRPGAEDPIGARLSVEPAEFAAQMQWLADHGYTPITLSELMAMRQGLLPAPANPIVLTFDDGYRDFYTNAWPVLKAHHFHATIFVITSVIDTERYLTRAMLLELDRSGLVEIGAHTVHHVDLTQVDNATLEHEVTDCATQLTAWLGHPVHSFAYPAGKFDSRVERAVAQAGYTVAVTTQPRFTASTDDPLALPRLRVVGGATLAEFAALLGGS